MRDLKVHHRRNPALPIYSKRLKRYKNNKQRKFENKLFRNNELFYKNLADNKTQNNNGIPNINEITRILVKHMVK
jgi:hypothetical protein